MSSLLKSALTAIQAGYSANTILEKIGQKDAKMGSIIGKSLAAGYAAPTILKYLLRSDESEDKFKTSYEKARTAQREHERQAVQTALGVIGTAAAAGRAAGPLALLGSQGPGIFGQQATQALAQTAVPGAVAQTPQATQAAQAAQQTANQAAQGIQALPGTQQTSQQQAVQQAQAGLTPAANILLGQQPSQAPAKPAIDVEKGILPRVSELEEQTGKVKFIDDMARRMLTTGKSPEQIYEEMKPTKVSGPYVKMYEDKQGKSYLDRIREIASESPEQIKEEIEKPKASIKFEAPSVEEKQIAPTRGEPVITPEGQVGDLRQIGKNKGIVNVDGKMYEFALNELTTLPKAYEKFEVDLTNIPEVDKSAPLREVAITPDKKMIVTKFWSWGEEPKGAYIYKRKDGQAFDDDFITKLVTEATPAKTTGDQFTGAWTPGGLSRGAGFHEYLKSNSQAFDAEDDPDKPFIYMPTSYEYLHPYEERVSKSLKTAKREFDIERKGIKADEKKAKRKKEI